MRAWLGTIVGDPGQGTSAGAVGVFEPEQRIVGPLRWDGGMGDAMLDAENEASIVFEEQLPLLARRQKFIGDMIENVSAGFTGKTQTPDLNAIIFVLDHPHRRGDGAP